MVSPDAKPALYESAWDIARASTSFEQGWRKFRRDNSSYSRDDLKPIFDSIYDKSQRVAYMEDSNQGYFLSKKKLQCPEGGNQLFYTFIIQYNLPGGDVREHYFHAKVDIQARIGGTNALAMENIAYQIKDRYRDAFRGVEDAMESITHTEMRQVKCMTGSD